MSRSHLPPGIPEGTDPRMIIDDGINPPYVASGRPYVPPARPAAPAVAPSPAAGKPTYKKVTTSDVVIQTATWGLLFLVLFFGGIAAVANSALWGLIGIAGGLYFAYRIIDLWIGFITLKRAGQISDSD